MNNLSIDTPSSWFPRVFRRHHRAILRPNLLPYGSTTLAPRWRRSTRHSEGTVTSRLTLLRVFRQQWAWTKQVRVEGSSRTATTSIVPVVLEQSKSIGESTSQDHVWPLPRVHHYRGCSCAVDFVLLVQVHIPQLTSPCKCKYILLSPQR